jgi:alpha/beta superfamily hydrolase
MDPVRFDTEDGVSLEGEIRRPEGAARSAAVICHPHPRRGGSKDHPLLWAIRNELARRGFAVLSFNFRGVMNSGGTYGGGRLEVRDVAAAIDRVGLDAPGPPLLAGWSFGASVALREAVEDVRIGALALVGIPLRPRDFDVPPVPDETSLRSLRAPALLLAGDRDEFCPPEELRALGERIERCEVVVAAGTNHFFWRREREAAGIVGEFANRSLAPSSGPTAGRERGP